MPKFMDVHEGLQLPAEAIANFRQETVEGTRDEFGVAQLELYHNEAGQVFCVLDGPSEEAVRKHHEALGVSCGDVHEVNSLL